MDQTYEGETHRWFTDGPHRVSSLGWSDHFGPWSYGWNGCLVHALLREVWACVWDCPAGCTSIVIAALLGYGYHLSFHYHRS